MLVSAFTAIVVFVIIVVIASVISWWIGAGMNYDQSYTKTFISILMCAIAIVLLLYYYNVLTLQAKTDLADELTNLQDTSETAISNVVDTLIEANEIIPHFVSTLYPIHFTPEKRPSAEAENDVHNAIITKIFVSKKIFYSWQAVVNTGYQGRGSSFIAFFLQQAHSHLLAEEWKLLKINYSSSTQKLGELLFQYSSTITENTVENYQSTAIRLMADPTFADVFCGG